MKKWLCSLCVIALVAGFTVVLADEDKEDEAKMAAFSAEMEAVKAEVHSLTAKFPLY